MNLPLCSLLVASLALAACHREPALPVTATASTTSQFVRHDWLLPASPGAAQPDLVATSDGRLLLSWINSVPGRRKALQFAAWGGDGRWQSAPRTIAVGDSLLTDNANTPQIATTTDGALWVHWLQKPGSGEASNLMLSRSADGGFNWSPPARVNNEAGDSEHGFAALWPASRNSIGIAWLDGASDNPVSPGGGHKAPAPAATALNAAVFDGELRRSNESQIDTMTCDCCRTAVAMTGRGALLVYRDRTTDEIRDIAATRLDGTKWSAPKPVHADGWKMPACPVNGPAVAANGNDVMVAWYTAAGDVPAVELARSRDAGDSFDEPIVIEHGAAVQGRVALAIDAQQAWVLWLREDTSGQSLWLARYAPDLSRQLQRIEVAKLQGRGRGTGFPQLALRDGDAYIAWTDLIDGAPQLRGARFGHQ